MSKIFPCSGRGLISSSFPGPSPYPAPQRGDSWQPRKTENEQGKGPGNEDGPIFTVLYLLLMAVTTDIFISLLDTIVVNLGVALEAWTNGFYRATRHRVRNSTTRERLSTVFSIGPTIDCVIEPLDSELIKDLPVYKSDDMTRVELPYIYDKYLAWRQEDNFRS